MADAEIALADPAERGSLVVRDHAVQNIAVATALTCEGVHRHSTGLGRLAGRDLPRATVDVAGGHVCAELDIAVDFGRPLRIVAADVSEMVSDALSTHSGLTVDRVTVHVATVIPPGKTSNSGRTLS